MTRHKKAVLVTGTSSGNGRAIALHLSGLGYKVFAAVRSLEDADNITNSAKGDLTAVILDILKEDDIDNAFEFVKSNLYEDEQLYAIVNNAGIIALSPIETTPINDVRYIMDLNFNAHVAVIQKFLPLLRESKGKVINISSIAGRISFPLMGIYSASKAAINAMSDALRIEVAKWGIEVITIEPGAIKTPGWIKAENKFDILAAQKNKFIRKFYPSEFRFISWALKHQSIMQTSSSKVAKQVANALENTLPRATYRVGFGARWLNFLAKFIALNWGGWMIIRLVRKVRLGKR